MTGRSNMRALEESIEATGGEDAIFEQIASGKTITKMADDRGVSRGLFHKWLGQTDGRRERLREARKMSASVLADEAKDILETSTKRTISVDRERARMRMWLSERFDRKTFGDKKDEVNIKVDIGLLHLQAMKKARIRDEQERAMLEGDAEVLPNPEPRALLKDGERGALNDGDSTQ